MNARKHPRARTTYRSGAPGLSDPDNWATGNQPMTTAQAKYLRLLCEESGAAFEAKLTKARAAKLIDRLRTHPGHRLG